jgi:hypothetical protein
MTSGAYGGNDVRQQIRRAVYGALIDKIRTDRFPSPSMMDLVEQGADQEQLIDYAEVLLDKVQDDQYPSVDMIQRLTKLA